jgi:hypothetical protein
MWRQPPRLSREGEAQRPLLRFLYGKRADYKAESCVAKVPEEKRALNRIFQVESSKREEHTSHKRGTADLADPRTHAPDKALDSREMLVPGSTLHPWLR